MLPSLYSSTSAQSIRKSISYHREIDLLKVLFFFDFCYCEPEELQLIEQINLLVNHSYNKTKKQEEMHFVKFHTVSQMQNNIELINDLLNKSPPSSKDLRTASDSPIHNRAQSSLLPPQHAFAISLESTHDPQTPTTPTSHYQRPSTKNPQTPKSRNYQADSSAKPNHKPFFGGKLRKASENNIINEMQPRQERQDLFSSQNIKNFIRTPKNTPNLKERKSSCNLDFTALFKKGRKDSENNSGHEKKNRRKQDLLQKRNTGWDENNNFQFSMNINSDEAQPQDEPTNLPEIPKLQNLRKQSENESPKKSFPSFLNNFKNHKNSLDIDISKKGSKFNIQNFIILKELGKGTFGRVILAVERQSKMIFAIKIIAKRQIRQSNMIEQLIRELKIQQSINHPNIIKVYGFFDDLLHFYIIMECALDSHLSETIKKRVAPASDAESATTINQICQAIAHLHSQSIIHRDLKPDNILFHEGVVKITDFGWSVRRDSRLRTTFCGTPVYLCPQILIGDEYDESVDIWTIGVILYEIYNRSNPFRITCKDELINILNQPIYFDQKIQMCPAAKDFIEICLKKRAVDRPNIRELLLHQFLLKAVNVEEIKR